MQLIALVWRDGCPRPKGSSSAKCYGEAWFCFRNDKRLSFDKPCAINTINISNIRNTRLRLSSLPVRQTYLAIKQSLDFALG